jgi:sulfur carrier protein
MTIRVNGEVREVAPGSTLGALLDALGVRRDGMAVACNDAVIPRARVDATPLAAGDRVEIIVPVAGG